MSARGEDYIPCQSCGDPLRAIRPGERKRIAENPYNYIFFCDECKRRGLHIEDGFK